MEFKGLNFKPGRGSKPEDFAQGSGPGVGNLLGLAGGVGTASAYMGSKLGEAREKAEERRRTERRSERRKQTNKAKKSLGEQPAKKACGGPVAGKKTAKRLDRV